MTQEKKKKSDKAHKAIHGDEHADGTKEHHSDAATKKIQQQHEKEAHARAEEKAAKARAEAAHAAALRKAEDTRLAVLRAQQLAQDAQTLKPEERSKNKISQYKDRHGTSYTYDDHGRVTGRETKDGCRAIIRYGADGKPHGFQLKNRKNQLLAQVGGSEHIEVNQNDGSVKVVAINGDKKSHCACTVTRFHADNKIETQTLDHHYRPISMTVREPADTAAGTKIISRCEFKYSDRNGIPTADENHIDDKKSVVCVVKDSRDKVTDRYQFADTAAVHANKPALREQVSYTVDTNNHLVKEAHQAFDLRGARPQLVSTVENTYDSASGDATVNTRLADGTFQHVKFDKTGKTIELTHQDKQHNLAYSLKNGAIAGVLDGGKRIDDLQALHTLLKLGCHAIATNLSLAAHAKNESGILSHELALEAPGRPGTKPSGTLVWADGGTLHQSTVKDGKFSYKDKSGQIHDGTVHDDGSFELAGKRTNIKALAEGSAFHGVGSDGSKLDVSSDKDKGGFTGTLKDGRSVGRPTYGVINGNIYDKNGSFKGHLDAQGMVHTPDGPAAGTRINSLNDGCTFEGTENGKHRTFVCNDQAPMSAGRMFIPGQRGSEEYDVRMGMIINKRTGDQLGILIPPQAQGDRMTGGEIYRTDTHPPRSQALCNFKNTVFEVDLFERKGAFGTAKLRGACLGAQEHDLGGHITGGGLLNVQAAIEVQNNALAAAQQKETANTGLHFSIDCVSGAQSDLAAAARTDQATAQMTIDSLNRMMQTGKVSAHTLQQIGAITTNTKVDLAGGDDTLAGQRLQIDQTKVAMERLPDDTRHISGQVIIVDEHAPHGHRQLAIKNGIVYATDGKTQFARIDSPDGHMTMINPATHKLVPGSMRTLTGSVWHLNWKDKNNQAQSADLVSLGDNDGVASITALRKQAHLETQAALVAHKESNSDESRALLDDTKNAEAQFNKRLDRILKTGTECADVSFLKKGAGNVRMDSSSADDPPPESPRQKLEIPNLKSEHDVQSTNGKLRIDNHVYKIDKGQLFEMTSDHGRMVVSNKAAGILQPGYNVHFVGGESINLADHHRVLMQFTVGASKEVHQIIGLGPARNTDSFGQTEGGLVPIEDLYKQADEAKQKARQGNVEYFETRPYITGKLANNFMGNREECLAKFADSLDEQTKRLKLRTDDLFANGFDVQKVNNNKLDGAVDLTQLMVSNIGSDATSSVGLAKEGQQVQKMTNDAFVMAAETVATAGLGEVFAIAKNAKNLSTMVALAGEVSADVVACGAISMIGRANDKARASDNFYSGMVEGAVMGGGAVGAKAFGSLAHLQQTEALAVAVRNGSLVMADLAPAEQALLSTAIGKMCLAGKSASYIKTVSALYKITDSVVQTTGFNVAGNIREHNWDSMNPQAIVVGSSAMLFGQVLGHGFSSSAEKYLGLSQDGLYGQMVNNMAMAYGNGAAGAMDGALDKERERIAEQLHISKELVSTNMLYKYINWDNVVSDVNNAGLMASVSAPLMSVGSHFATDRLQATLTPEEYAARRAQARESRAADATENRDVPQLLGKLKRVAHTDLGDLFRGESIHSELPKHHSQRYAQEFHAAASELAVQHQADLAHGFSAAAEMIAMEPHGELSLDARLRIATQLRRNAERYQEKGQLELASGYEAAADTLVPDHRIPQSALLSGNREAIVEHGRGDSPYHSDSVAASEQNQLQGAGFDRLQFAIAENRRADDALARISDAELRTLANPSFAKDGAMTETIAQLAGVLKDLPQEDPAKKIAADRARAESTRSFELLKAAIKAEPELAALTDSELADSAAMLKRLEKYPDLLPHYQKYKSDRENSTLLAAAYHAQVDVIKPKLQAVIDDFVRRCNADASNDLVLPPINLSKGVTAKSEISALYELGQGTVRFRTDALLNAGESAQLVASLMHEVSHAEQDALIVRRIADEITAGDPAGIPVTTAQRAEIARRYQQIMHKNPSAEFMEGILNARHRPLNAAESSRAERLVQTLSAPVTADLSDLGGRVRILDRRIANVKDVKTSNLIYDDFIKDPHLVKKIFGDAGAPEAVQKFIDYYAQTKGTDRWNGAAARHELERALTEMRAKLEIDRAEAYQRYRNQEHEVESFAVGELAFRQAREFGITDSSRTTLSSSKKLETHPFDGQHLDPEYVHAVRVLATGEHGLNGNKLFPSIKDRLIESDFCSLVGLNSIPNILELGLHRVLAGQYGAGAAKRCLEVVAHADRPLSSDAVSASLKVIEAMPESQLRTLTLSLLAANLMTKENMLSLPQDRQAAVLMKILRAAAENGSATEFQKTADICSSRFPEKALATLSNSDMAILSAALTTAHRAREAGRRGVDGLKLTIPEYVRLMVDQLNPEPYTERQHSQLLRRIAPADQQLAMQVLVERAKFMTSAGLEGILRDAYSHLGDHSYLWTKKSGLYIDVPKITGVCVGTAGDGAALAYLFRKYNGVDVELRVIKPGEIPTDLQNAVLFDSPRKLLEGSKLSPAELEAKLREANIVVPEELVGNASGTRKGFSDGLNIFDMAVAEAARSEAYPYISAGDSTTNLRGEFVMSMAGGRTRAEAKLRLAVSAARGEHPPGIPLDFQAVHEAMETETLARKHRQEVGGLLYFYQKMFFDSHLPHLITTLPEYITYGDMVEQFKGLHRKIFKDATEIDENVRFVTMADKDGTAGSSELMTKLYREANNLAARKYDRNFVDSKTLQAQVSSGALTSEQLAKLTVVGLDDFIYSGGHVKDQITALGALQSGSARPKRVIMAHLGAFEEGANKAIALLNGASSKHIELIEAQDMRFKTLAENHEAYARFSDFSRRSAKRSPEEAERILANLNPQATHQGLSADPSNVVALLTLPYMVPNNSYEKAYTLFRDYMGLPGSSSKDVKTHSEAVQNSTDSKLLQESPPLFEFRLPVSAASENTRQQFKDVVPYCQQLGDFLRTGGRLPVMVPSGDSSDFRTGVELALLQLEENSDSSEASKKEIEQARRFATDLLGGDNESNRHARGLFQDYLAREATAERIGSLQRLIDSEADSRVQRELEESRKPKSKGDKSSRRRDSADVAAGTADSGNRQMPGEQSSPAPLPPQPTNKPLTVRLLEQSIAQLNHDPHLTLADMSSRLRDHARTLVLAGHAAEASDYLAAADKLSPNPAAHYGYETENGKSSEGDNGVAHTEPVVHLGSDGLIKSTVSAKGIELKYSWTTVDGKPELTAVTGPGNRSLTRESDGTWQNKLKFGPPVFKGEVTVDEHGSLMMLPHDNGAFERDVVILGLDGTSTEHWRSGGMLVRDALGHPSQATSKTGRSTVIEYDDPSEIYPSVKSVKFQDGSTLTRDGSDPMLWTETDADGSRPWRGGVAVSSLGLITRLSELPTNNRVNTLYDCLDDIISTYPSDLTTHFSVEQLPGGKTRESRKEGPPAQRTLIKDASGRIEQVVNDRYTLNFTYEGDALKSVAFPTGSLVKIDADRWDLVQAGKQKGRPFASAVSLDERGNLSVRPLRMHEDFTGKPVEELLYRGNGDVRRQVAQSDAEYRPEQQSQFDARDFLPKPSTLQERLLALLKREPAPPVLTKSHFEVTADSAGRPVEGVSEVGDKYKIRYGENGEAERLELEHLGTTGEKTMVHQIYVRKNGVWERQPETVTGADSGGSASKSELTDFQIEKNGAITLHFADDNSKRLNPEGYWSQLNRLDCESVEGTAIDVVIQREGLLKLFKQGAVEPARAERIDALFQKFESRMHDASYSNWEVANCYLSVRRMLESDDAILPLRVRLRLAEQVAFNLAYPHRIDQGAHSTCNVTAEVETRFFSKYPLIATQLVTDVATTGKYILPDHTVIDMRYMEGALLPQRDSLNSLNLPFAQNCSDISEDGGRSYADQLLQMTVINAHWQRESFDPQGRPCRRASTVEELEQGLPFHPGDVRFEYAAPLNIIGRPSSDLRDMLRIHTADGTEAARYLSAVSKIVDPLLGEVTGEQNIYEGTRIENPFLSDSNLIDLSATILGFDEPAHYISLNSDPHPGMRRIHDEADLIDFLKAKQERGDMPITARVDTRNPPFNRANEPTPDAGGGAHVVLIHSIKQDVDGDYDIEFSNQWGDYHNFMPDGHNPDGKSISAGKFYRAMQEYAAPPQSRDIYDAIDSVRSRTKAQRDAVLRAIKSKIAHVKRTLGG